MSDLPGYLLYRVLSGLFGLFPEPLMRRSGMILGRLFYTLAPGRRRIVERHMQRVAEGPVDASVVKDAFRSYGRYWAEVFWVRPRRKQAIVDHSIVVGAEPAYEALRAGRGVIFALPHLGNWEAAGAKAEAIDLKVLAAAEALSNERIVQWFVRCRTQLGMDIVVARRGTGTMRALAERLAGPGVVALVADRDIKGKGVRVRFFGEDTTMPAGPVALADRTGAALFPVGCYFNEGRGHTMVVFDEIKIPDSPDRAERIAAGTQGFATALETVIRRAPEQWHLFVPNWPSDVATADDVR